jgi:hypothetical protein
MLALELVLIGTMLFAGSLMSYAAPSAPGPTSAPGSAEVSGPPASQADGELALPTGQIIVK